MGSIRQEDVHTLYTTAVFFLEDRVGTWCWMDPATKHTVFKLSNGRKKRETRGQIQISTPKNSRP